MKYNRYREVFNTGNKGTTLHLPFKSQYKGCYENIVNTEFTRFFESFKINFTTVRAALELQKQNTL